MVGFFGIECFSVLSLVFLISFYVSFLSVSCKFLALSIPLVTKLLLLIMCFAVLLSLAAYYHVGALLVVLRMFIYAPCGWTRCSSSLCWCHCSSNGLGLALVIWMQLLQRGLSLI